MSRIKIIILALFLLSIINATSAFSDEPSKAGETLDPILEEIRWLQAESIITIATRHETPISKAPGIATVITAKQIKQMGFRTLVDILKIVPGFDVSMDNIGTRQIAVRGFSFGTSERVRILIDGHAVNDPYWGGAMNNFHDLVVENIKRIEVIRGPGSALYGKNAFVGIVNVVTKDTEDIDGFQWTLSGGSFDTQNYNLLLGKEYGDLKISGFFDWFDTEGPSRTVERDALFPATFSKSPGRSQNEREKTDLNIKLSYKNLEFKGKYMKKRREGYIGIEDALNDETMLKDTYAFVELTYNNFTLGERLSMIPKIYFDYYYLDDFHEALPDGYTDPFRRVYPDGFQGRIGTKQTTIGFENQFNYDVFDGNRLTFGFQYEWIHQNDVRSSKYTFDPSNSFAPISPPRSFSDTFPFTRDRATRQIWSVYLQNEWSITDDLDLTVGVRHDQFTRFGGTTNPRVGLVWRFIENAHLKFLFGTAFRAPNFREMFLTNQPIINGNTSLDPEKINTYEFEIGYNFTKHISGSLDFFFNRVRDIIKLTPQAGGALQYQNKGGARIKGVEAEIRADFGEDSYAYANYTYQDAEETTNRNRLPDVPIHKANFGINQKLGKYVNAHLNTFVTGRRPRESGDTRSDLPSHALVNLTLIGKNMLDHFEIRGSVFDLFDHKYDDPSAKGGVPTDYPQAGRSFMIEMRIEF